MATKEEMERLIGKAVMDKHFRDQLLKNPKESASNIGIELAPEQEKAFKEGNFPIVAQELEKIQSKSSVIFKCIK